MIYFILLLVIYIGIYAILSLSLNIVTGYTGLLSLCQAAFFGIGAYTSAILLTRTHINFWWILLLAGVVASLAGILIGLPTLRLKGDYLAIATLGFGEITRNVLLNWDSLTRGPLGISGIPAVKVFGFTLDPMQKVEYVVFVWFFVLVTYVVLNRIMKSRVGRALEAIREDEVAAFSMGINVTKYKMMAFGLSAFFGGIAGTLWTVYNQSVNPSSFDFLLSVMLLCMVVLGGMGNQLAVILGAVLIEVAGELPRLLGFSSIVPPQFKQILFGLILVVMMIYRPQGLIGRRVPKSRIVPRQSAPDSPTEVSP
ncbi:MAG TPA: branched-chain amino acid ABC transporter permease [Spirochaetia bacterium]|nr:branched-chain amino acid ABC transporter permease [Spirochaetia bacterium]